VRCGDWATTLECWDRSISRFLGTPVPAGWRAARAEALAALGRLVEAEAALTALARDYPTVQIGFVDLAKLVQQRRQWEVQLNAGSCVCKRFPPVRLRPAGSRRAARRYWNWGTQPTPRRCFSLYSAIIRS
jgi:hypothetical protein